MNGLISLLFVFEFEVIRWSWYDGWCAFNGCEMMPSYMKLIPFDFESFKHFIFISLSILFIEVSAI